MLPHCIQIGLISKCIITRLQCIIITCQSVLYNASSQKICYETDPGRELHQNIEQFVHPYCRIHVKQHSSQTCNEHIQQILLWQRFARSHQDPKQTHATNYDLKTLKMSIIMIIDHDQTNKASCNIWKVNCW